MTCNSSPHHPEGPTLTQTVDPVLLDANWLPFQSIQVIYVYFFMRQLADRSAGAACNGIRFMAPAAFEFRVCSFSLACSSGYGFHATPSRARAGICTHPLCRSIQFTAFEGSWILKFFVTSWRGPLHSTWMVSQRVVSAWRSFVASRAMTYVQRCGVPSGQPGSLGGRWRRHRARLTWAPLLNKVRGTPRDAPSTRRITRKRGPAARGLNPGGSAGSLWGRRGRRRLTWGFMF